MAGDDEGPLDRNRGLLSDAQQQQLQRSRILIAGVGGVGGRAAETLTRMGIGALRLTDPDAFSISNVNRQAAASLRSVGFNKAHVVGELCKEIGTGTRIETDEHGISADNVDQMLAGADLVIDGTDYTRPQVGLLLARAARERDIPLLLAVEVGYSVWHTTFAPEGQTFERFFGLPESVMPSDLESGRISVPLRRWVNRVPSYADISTLKKVSAGRMEAPAIAPAVELSAGLLSTAAVAQLTGNKPIAIAPNVHHVDLWTGRAALTRPSKIKFHASAARAGVRRRESLAQPEIEPMMDALDCRYRPVIELAARAPSAHNTQPWRLRALSNDTVELSYVRDTRLPHDPDNRDAYLALGAYVETAALIANSRRMSLQFEAKFDVRETRHTVGTVTFAENAVDSIDPLAAVVHRRHTNRRPYTRAVPSSSQRDEMAALGNHMLFGADILRLVTRANVASWADPQFLADLGKWISSDPGAPDGLTRESLCLGSAEWALVRGAIQLGRLPRPVGHMFAASDVKLFGGDRTVIYVLGARSFNPRDVFEAGRRLLRSWCTLTQYGWSSHPISVIVDRHETRSDLAYISGVVNPVAVYRAGIPTAPVAISNRRPVSALGLT